MTAHKLSVVTESQFALFLKVSTMIWYKRIVMAKARMEVLGSLLDEES